MQEQDTKADQQREVVTLRRQAIHSSTTEGEETKLLMRTENQEGARPPKCPEGCDQGLAQDHNDVTKATKIAFPLFLMCLAHRHAPYGRVPEYE